jgi:multimeric flavodoxin WrbA
MRILLAYYSETGNTAKIAQAIYAEVSSQGHEAHLIEIGEIVPETLNAYDLEENTNERYIKPGLRNANFPSATQARRSK